MTMSLTSCSPLSRPIAKADKARLLQAAAQHSLTAFKRVVYRPYQHAPHLEALDRALEQVARYVETGGREGIGRLVIEMPPRHGKTLTVSRLFPTWVLGRNPDKRIMLVSYGATLALKNSRVARNLIRTPRFRAIFGGLELADDSAAVDSWELKGHEGGCDAMGIDGGATGKGAHVLIIDDPIKNRAQAESETYRSRVWDAYTNDLYTRLEPGGAIIIMMTRWHRDDLIGRVMGESADDDDEESDEVERWVRLRMPAMAEDANDPLGRAEGEALWPWRYPLPRLQKIARAVGRYVWAALYQQRPEPREGGLFQWAHIDENRARSHPDLTRVVVAVDPSGSAEGDAVGVMVAGKGRDGHAYVLSDRTLNGTPGQWARAVVRAYHEHQADRVVAEKNYGGEMVEAVIRTQDAKVSYKGITATRGKEVRAEPVAALYEQRLVHHVGEFSALEDEMTTWKPGGKSPNRMDALVWALTELMLGAVQDYRAPKVRIRR